MVFLYDSVEVVTATLRALPELFGALRLPSVLVVELNVVPDPAALTVLPASDIAFGELDEVVQGWRDH